jgi:hypothetical protein
MKNGAPSGEQVIPELGRQAERDAEPGEPEITTRVHGDGEPPVEFSAVISDETGDIFHLHAHYDQHCEALESVAALNHLVWEVRSFQAN